MGPSTSSGGAQASVVSKGPKLKANCGRGNKSARVEGSVEESERNPGQVHNSENDEGLDVNRPEANDGRETGESVVGEHRSVGETVSDHIGGRTSKR